jgi:hypothetical protein
MKGGVPKVKAGRLSTAEGMGINFGEALTLKECQKFVAN